MGLALATSLAVPAPAEQPSSQQPLPSLPDYNGNFQSRQRSLAAADELRGTSDPETTWMRGRHDSQSSHDFRSTQAQNSPVVTTQRPQRVITASASQPASSDQRLTANSSAVVNQRAGFNDPAGSGHAVTANYEASTGPSTTNKQGLYTPLQPRSAQAAPVQSTSGSSTVKMLVSAGSSLAVVIGFFLGCAWLYRKSFGNTLGRGLPKHVVQVLGRAPVAPRQQMVLLRFGPKLVLVSLVQGDARTISEITDPLEVDRIAGLCESQQADSMAQSFREILTQGARV
ncbi:MAG: flagellar biosynthetic protein FliO [Pirellulaceae bacterium]|nr:flagellar biosynthetic protein FliO [Pirellulaceae bacterium]